MLFSKDSLLRRRHLLLASSPSKLALSYGYAFMLMLYEAFENSRTTTTTIGRASDRYYLLVAYWNYWNFEEG